MRILVTGGAGFLGRHLVRHLVDRDHRVRVVDLEPFEDDRFEGDPVEFMRADVADEERMLEACRDVDVVVHAAAALPIQPEDEIHRTDYQGTRRTARAASEQGVDRFVYISTTAVYGIPDEHPIDETFPLNPLGPYGEAKARAERACREHDDMLVSVLRPKTFVGPERLGVMEVLFDWIRRGKRIYVLGDGTNPYQLLDVEDLCGAIWLACTHPDAAGTFNVGATEFTTLNQDVRPVLEAADSGARLVHLPARPIQLVLRALESLRLSPLVRWQYETMDKDSVVSSDKLRRTLGWEPRYSTRETIMRNFEWYMDHYREFEDRTGRTHRVPWDQKILKWIRRLS